MGRKTAAHRRGMAKSGTGPRGQKMALGKSIRSPKSQPRFRGDDAGRQLPARSQSLRLSGHDRQCLGMDRPGSYRRVSLFFLAPRRKFFSCQWELLVQAVGSDHYIPAGTFSALHPCLQPMRKCGISLCEGRRLIKPEIKKVLQIGHLYSGVCNV